MKTWHSCGIRVHAIQEINALHVYCICISAAALSIMHTGHSHNSCKKLAPASLLKCQITVKLGITLPPLSLHTKMQHNYTLKVLTSHTAFNQSCIAGSPRYSNSILQNILTSFKAQQQQTMQFLCSANGRLKHTHKI